MLTYHRRPASSPRPPAESVEPPVFLLVHGTLGTSATWDPVAEDLATRGEVVTVDLPGAGDSPFLDEVSTLEDFAATVVEVLDDAEVDRAIWVGHSLGGMICAAALGVCPERMAGLVLAYSTALPDTDEQRRGRDETIAQARRDGLEAYVDEAAPGFFRGDAPARVKELYSRQGMTWSVPALSRSYTAVRDRQDRSDDLAAHPEIPTLVLRGHDDDVIRYLDPEAYPHVTQLRTDTGHMGIMTIPHTLAGAILGWWKDLGA